MSDGIFTHPGPDGIFGHGQGGKPADPSSPVIDSDDNDLRETLVAIFPSPGHMRVARATRSVKTGRVEKYEEFREPTERERAILAQQGVVPPPAAPVAMPASYPPAPSPLVAPQLGAAADPSGGNGSGEGWPWFKLAIAAGVGAAALWAAQKYVMPMVGGEGARENPRDDDDDADGDKGDDGED